MNGTELRSVSHFKILTKMAYPHLGGNFQIRLILIFVFIHCKAVEVSKNDQIQM